VTGVGRTETDVQQTMEAKGLDVKVLRIDWNEENATNIGMYHIHRSYLICFYSFHGFSLKYIRKSPLNFVGFDRQFFYTNCLISTRRRIADQKYIF
jgi:hypothetical protein